MPAKRPCPWCRGSCHKLGFWGSQTSRGSPLRISVSPPPAPHPSRSFSCPDTRRGARLSHGNGARRGGRIPSLGVGLAPECPFTGGSLGGAALLSYTLHLQEIPEEAGSEQAQLPRPMESPEPWEAPPGSWEHWLSTCPGGSRLLGRPPTSCPKLLQEKTFLPTVTVSSVSNRGPCTPGGFSLTP